MIVMFWRCGYRMGLIEGGFLLNLNANICSTAFSQEGSRLDNASLGHLCMTSRQCACKDAMGVDLITKQ